MINMQVEDLACLRHAYKFVMFILIIHVSRAKFQVPVIKFYGIFHTVHSLLFVRKLILPIFGNSILPNSNFSRNVCTKAYIGKRHT